MVLREVLGVLPTLSPSTLNHRITRNPQPSNHPQPSTLNPNSSTLNPARATPPAHSQHLLKMGCRVFRFLGAISSAWNHFQVLVGVCRMRRGSRPLPLSASPSDPTVELCPGPTVVLRERGLFLTGEEHLYSGRLLGYSACGDSEFLEPFRVLGAIFICSLECSACGESAGLPLGPFSRTMPCPYDNPTRMGLFHMSEVYLYSECLYSACSEGAAPPRRCSRRFLEPFSVLGAISRCWLK